MRKSAISHVVAGIGALAILSGSAAAQKDISVYSGQSVKEQGIQLSSWGSGAALESKEVNYGGPNSIKVTTHGRFQGARLILASPIDLKSAAADPSAYLQFTYQIADRTGSGGLGGLSGGGEGGPYGGGGKGGRGGPGFSGGGAPGGGQYGGGGRGGDVKTNKPKAISTFRIVLVTTDDKRLDTDLSLDNSRLQRDQWKGIAVPVATIRGLKETSGTIKEIQFFGDGPGVVYLGEIRVLRDDTPIRVDDLAEQTIAKNDTLTFTASAEAGPTPLKYEWTIQGVPSNEPSARSEVTAAYNVVGDGRTFKHQFRKSGDYNVTLTVTDINGLKKSVTRKTSIHVTL